MGIGAAIYKLNRLGQVLNVAVSFVVFWFLDLFDAFLCIIYKVLDYAIESGCKPCYCYPTSKLEEISNTLYSRSLIIDKIINKANSAVITDVTIVSPIIVEMLQDQRKCKEIRDVPRWSDCDCKTCNSWSSSLSLGESLYVHVEDMKEDTRVKEDVVFIHGFASSSAFWTETVFKNFNEETKMNYRLLALDLLGFGKSPKPSESLYTLQEHVTKIEQSLEMYKVDSLHIVAHSLGCILAVALAARHPKTVKSLTLVAPPYFPAANGEERAQVVMRQFAPRQVWPLMTFGVSLAIWYEHISRTICLIICKNHRLWEIIFKLATLNRFRTFLIESFFCHTHSAAWHTLHNIICGSGSKIDNYLDVIRERIECNVTIFHGYKDKLIPVDCSYAIQSKVPRATVNIVDGEDHLSIVLGQQTAFARQLEEGWKIVN